jgi:colanic acid/amylovoran biosynthesis glycosyltransferase
VGAADATPECVAYKGRLDALITERGLWGKVHLEGRQDQDGVRRFLDIAHVFVAPFVETETGDKDGIPTSLLEAMACGLPAVATDAGSISEVITTPEEGVVVPQRSPQAMASAIEALLSDPARRRHLGLRASAAVKNRFDIRVCEAAFHERIRQLLRSGATRPAVR